VYKMPDHVTSEDGERISAAPAAKLFMAVPVLSW
jgi:hypothetical protein